MREKKHPLKGLIQRLYITWDTFVSNDLFTYASSGAYSFFMSAVPIILMVLVILLRILNTSPEQIRELAGNTRGLTGALDLATLLDSVMSIRSVGVFELILGFSVFWMARQFFASIQQGMKVIYRKRGKGKPIKENLVVIAGEVILVILIVSVIIGIIGANAFFRTAFSENVLPPLLFAILKQLFRFALLAVIFIFLFLVYYVTPRTRPRALYSLFAAAACTLSLGIVQIVFQSFVNMTKYNLVYGILSGIIVLLLQVYMFFFLFLFFAQFQYVFQFFDSFLLAQLYLMPAWDAKDPVKQIERILFIEPPFFYRRYAVRMASGSEVFRIGDTSTELYYIWNGAVRLVMPNQVLEIGRGQIFGEFSSIVGGSRTATAVALTDLVLLRIPASLFQETVEVNGNISRRTLQMISDYVRKKNHVPLSTDE